MSNQIVLILQEIHKPIRILLILSFCLVQDYRVTAMATVLFVGGWYQHGSGSVELFRVTWVGVKKSKACAKHNIQKLGVAQQKSLSVCSNPSRLPCLEVLTNRKFGARVGD